MNRTVKRRSAAVSAALRAGETPALHGELRIRNRGYLPHWEREGGRYFITFRLAGSLPQSVLDYFILQRDAILFRAEQQNRELTDSERTQLADLFSEQVEKYLDSGVGECYMARPEIAHLVARALQTFEGKRYRLWAWSVMLNHVHVVVEPLSGHVLEEILHSWKSYTSHKANHILRRRGEFWQKEYYDHLIRDEQELAALIRYVEENPAKAGLKNWPWCSAGVPPAPEDRL